MKNRGLVAHKSKLNRNPRVKKREQYRKALVRRKGHVREVRMEERRLESRAALVAVVSLAQDKLKVIVRSITSLQKSLR
jgi:Sas10 C-terminal domain